MYSGDVDANVPIVGTLNWINRLKENEGWPVMEPWREWWIPGLHKHEDQVAGMVWKLRGFTFVSVKGAGHLVPKDKRREARQMFESFMDGKDLPYKTE